MYEVDFYKDRRGRQPVKELLQKLREESNNSKDARIQYEKILTHIRALENFGTRLGEPMIKHIDGALWEMRPLSHRVLFFHWQAKKFVLLHHFVKKTQKTPMREIEQARNNMRDFLERNK